MAGDEGIPLVLRRARQSSLHRQEEPARSSQRLPTTLAAAELVKLLDVVDLKQAVERLGQAPPSNRQLLLLRFMGLVAPPPGASIWLRIRGILLIIALVIVLLAIGLGIVELIALPFGGVSLVGGLILGLLVVVIALGILALVGRRRQAKARAQGAARAG